LQVEKKEETKEEPAKEETDDEEAKRQQFAEQDDGMGVFGFLGWKIGDIAYKKCKENATIIAEKKKYFAACDNLQEVKCSPI
jgi:hypothetical protein